MSAATHQACARVLHVNLRRVHDWHFAFNVSHISQPLISVRIIFSDNNYRLAVLTQLYAHMERIVVGLAPACVVWRLRMFELNSYAN